MLFQRAQNPADIALITAALQQYTKPLHRYLPAHTPPLCYLSIPLPPPSAFPYQPDPAPTHLSVVPLPSTRTIQIQHTKAAHPAIDDRDRHNGIARVPSRERRLVGLDSLAVYLIRGSRVDGPRAGRHLASSGPSSHSSLNPHTGLPERGLVRPSHSECPGRLRKDPSSALLGPSAWMSAAQLCNDSYPS